MINAKLSALVPNEMGLSNSLILHINRREIALCRGTTNAGVPQWAVPAAAASGGSVLSGVSE